MITPKYAKTMARYNRWQNRSLIAAADGLSDQQRWQDTGAFFKSIAQTLNHILWDDRIWLARLQGDEVTADEIGQRHPYTDTPKDWSDYKQARAKLDDTIIAWVGQLSEADFATSIPWIRGTEAVETNFGFNLVHMMNHQTHHRGQIHGMLTGFGATPVPTDLQMLPVIDGEPDA